MGSNVAASAQKWRLNEKEMGGDWKIRSGVERSSEVEFIIASSNGKF